MIHKYRVPLTAFTDSIEMPRGAKILHVHEQGIDICVWAMIWTSQPMVPRRLRLVGTGHEVPIPAEYVGTVHVSGGVLVFHLFDLGEGART